MTHLSLLKRLATLLLLTIAVSACAVQKKEPRPFTKADLVRAFDIVAFGREFQEKDTAYVVKFDKPIDVLVLHGPFDSQSPTFVKRTISRIQSAQNAPDFGRIEFFTGGDLDKDSIKDYELIVFALGPKNYEQLHARFSDGIWKKKKRVAEHFFFSRCGGWISHRDGALRLAMVFMDVDQMSAIHEPCIIEEMYQSMGLPDDDDSLVWSIFNDSNGKEFPGDFDKLLMAILYAEELTPGMDRKEAMALVPGIVDRLWIDHQRDLARKISGSS